MGSYVERKTEGLRTAHAREEKLPDGPKMLCAVAPARGMRHGTIEVVFVSTTY